MNNKHGLGFTLTEMMIVVAIIGILAATAVPSFGRLIERSRLKEAVESLKSDLMFTRTQAIKRSKNLNISIAIDGESWCYGIDDDNTACSCTVSGDCAIKTVDGNQFQGTTLDANDNVAFDFRRGTANAVGSTISTAHYSARVVVGGVGRVRICIPDGSALMGGYDRCQGR